MITRTYTGRKRLRVLKRAFKDPLLVLQVEIHEKGCYLDAHGGRDVDSTYWRDATIEDLTVIGEVEAPEELLP